MEEINNRRCVEAYNRLYAGPIDEIDAAIFTGDMFSLEANRIEFQNMIDRWERQLKVWEEIDEENS